MQPLHVEATCTEDGVITLRGLPIQEGDAVEVVVIPRSSASLSDEERYSLCGEPVEYIDPFKPVAERDWHASE